MLALPGAVLAVHELRYVLAYGSHAAAQLSAHGDHYVASATVVAGALVAISIGVAAVRLVAIWRGRVRVEIVRAPLWVLWLGLVLVLFAGFCALEALELVFEPHRVAAGAAILGSGGWWAVPAAAVVAAVMALLVHGGRALLGAAARRRVVGQPTVLSVAHRAFHCDIRPHQPMATCAAGRAPPVAELG